MHNYRFRYFVGSVHSTVFKGQHTYSLPRYYIDTRDDPYNYGTHSNIFTSTHNAEFATRYDTYEEAVAWRKEFLLQEDNDPEYVIFKEQYTV
jgi:hypothetical protein